MSLPSKFRSYNAVSKFLKSLHYDENMNSIDDYFLLNPDSKKAALIGLAATLKHDIPFILPINVLEILGGIGLYSCDINKRLYNYTCRVADNAEIMEIGKKLNPHIEFINPNIILNPNSQKVIFTCKDYFLQLPSNTLRKTFSHLSSILHPSGFIFSEISIDKLFGISLSYYNINGRVSYKKANARLLTICLDYCPLLGKYVLGHSVWDRKTGEFLNSFRQSYYTNSLHYIKEIANSYNMSVSFYTCNLDSSLQADRIEFIPAQEIPITTNIFLKVVKND